MLYQMEMVFVDEDSEASYYRFVSPETTISATGSFVVADVYDPAMPKGKSTFIVHLDRFVCCQVEAVFPTKWHWLASQGIDFDEDGNDTVDMLREWVANNIDSD